MAEIILDIAANTHKNSKRYIKRMMDEVIALDSHKHTIIFKHQWFQGVIKSPAGDNIPLDPDVFASSYKHGEKKGYRVTSSVFDVVSLGMLLEYDIPFVKIACRPELYWLMGLVPRKHRIYVSYNGVQGPRRYNTDMEVFACVAEYPASEESYAWSHGHVNLSDHTVGLELFKKRKYLERWEKHLKLDDSTGLDAGPFAITPTELGEIL